MRSLRSASTWGQGALELSQTRGIQRLRSQQVWTGLLTKGTVKNQMLIGYINNIGILTTGAGVVFPKILNALIYSLGN